MFHYYPYTLKSFNKKNISKVSFKGMSNRSLKNKIFKSIYFQDLLRFKSKLTISHIDNIVKRLKDSGFFSHVKIRSFFQEENQFIVYLYLNPIIKSIQINSMNKLKIPKKNIKSIFKNQIGYPQNLKSIKDIMTIVEHWYFLRGYRWSRISYHIKNKNKLIINIQEGQIKKVKINCINNHLIDNFYQRELNLLIIQELQIMSGQILNYHTIESGIIRLKNQKIISNCYYKIQFDNNGTLQFFLKYHLPHKKWHCSFYQIIYLPYYFLNSIYVKYSSFLSKIEKSYFIYCRNNHSQNTFLKYFFNFSQCIDSIQHTLLIYKFQSIISSQHSISNFQKIKDNFKFNFYFNQIHNKCSDLDISFIKSAKSNRILLSYIYKKTHENKDKNNLYYINISRKNIETEQNISIFWINYINSIKPYLTNVFSETIEVNTIYPLLGILSINQKLRLIKRTYLSYMLYIYNSWQQHLSRVCSNQLKKNQIAYNKHASYTFNLSSNTSYSKDTARPNIFWKLSTKIVNFTMIYSQILKLPYQFNSLINFQYQQIIYLFNQNLHNIFNMILLNINIHAIRQNTYHQYCYNSTMKSFNFFCAIQNSKYTLMPKTYLLLKYDIEFYIYKGKNVGLFAFITSDNQFKYCMNNFKNLNKNFLGIGIMTNLQIKKLPDIKIKCEIHSKYNYKLYATFSFK